MIESNEHVQHLSHVNERMKFFEENLELQALDVDHVHLILPLKKILSNLEKMSILQALDVDHFYLMISSLEFNFYTIY